MSQRRFVRLVPPFALALVALSLLACGLGPILGGSGPATTPTAAAVGNVVTNAIMAKDVSGSNFEPVGITDSYPADQKPFHAVVTIKGAPANTKFRAVWTAVDVGSVAAPNTRIDETDLTSSGSRNLDFTLTPDGDAFPPGKYKVEIYVNDKLDRAVNFTVQEDQAAVPTSAPATVTVVPVTGLARATAPAPATATTARPTPSPTPAGCPPLPSANARPSGVVKGVTMALGTQGDNKDPVNPTTNFQPNAMFHAVVATQNAPANTKFTASWFATDIGAPDCNIDIDSTDLATDGTRNIDFTLSPNTSWPPGTYRVEISVNGTLDRVVSFTVGKATSAAPTATTARPPTTAPTRAPTVAAPPAPTSAPVTNSCDLQPGQSGILFTNTYDIKVLLTIGGGEWGTHDYWFDPKVTKPIQFPPGRYTATLSIPGKGNYKFSEDKVNFDAGKCYTFTTPQ